MLINHRSKCWKLIGFFTGLLFLTAPWPFQSAGETAILGFPSWAFYSIVTTLIFGIAMAIALRQPWSAEPLDAKAYEHSHD